PSHPDGERGSANPSWLAMSRARLAPMERERAGSADGQRVGIARDVARVSDVVVELEPAVREDSRLMRAKADQELGVVLPAAVRRDPEAGDGMKRRPLVRRRVLTDQARRQRGDAWPGAHVHRERTDDLEPGRSVEEDDSIQDGVLVSVVR